MESLSMPQSGAVVFWNARDSRRGDVAGVLSQYGLAELIPSQRTDNQRLKAAMVAVSGGKDVIVQAHKKKESNGYEVVRVHRHADVNQYELVYAAKVTEGWVVLTTGDADRQMLQAEYDAQANILPASDFGQVLVALVEAMNGVRLSERGGHYWLRGDWVDGWVKVAALLEACGIDGKSSIYAMTTTLSHETLRVLRDRLKEETEKAAAAIQEDVSTGDLSAVGLLSRQRRALAARERMAEYSDILGDMSGYCAGLLSAAEQAAAAAIAVAQSAKDEVFC